MWGRQIVIDAGNNSDSDTVVNYIKEQGVKNLKAVIKSFDVEKVYMPKVVHTSETFRDVLKVVSDKGIKVATAAKGVSIPLSGISAEFVGPVRSDYNNLNNHSAVLKLTYGIKGILQDVSVTMK